MTKIAISPNVNGTGTFTLAAPDSNTDRTLTLPDVAGEVVTTGSTGAVAQAMLANAVVPLGVGQTWQNVTASRAVGTTYTNTTGRPIFVSVYFAAMDPGREVLLTVAGQQVSTGQSSNTHDRVTISALVPAGATYAVTARFGSTQTLLHWYELR